MKLEVTAQNDNLTWVKKSAKREHAALMERIPLSSDPGSLEWKISKLSHDGELSSQTVLSLPIQEHANSIGVSIDLTNWKQEQACKHGLSS